MRDEQSLSTTTTPFSLLQRLQQSSDRDAWARFVELYTPLFFYWARKLGLQDADAADLVQDVFASLLVGVASFERRPGKRFRGWLWTVLQNKHRERQRRLAGRPETSAAFLEEATISDSTASIDDAEYQQYLVHRALQLMQAEFEPATWKACWEFVVAERPVTEVAAELGISVNAVYLAKSRVLRRLREELDGLLEE
jgi:RNA polymerase sigma-70 factor (ECF subfamily)